MKKLLFLLFSFPVVCFGQENKGYAQISANIEISKPLQTGLGGSFLVGRNVSNNVSIGAGFDILKYKNLDKVTPSIYADFRYNLGVGNKKPLIYFSVTPGYFFYSNSYRTLIGTSYNTYTYKGGFLIGAGFGCILYSGKRGASYLSIMYNKFPIKMESKNFNQSTSYDVAKINFGIKF